LGNFSPALFKFVSFTSQSARTLTSSALVTSAMFVDARPAVPTNPMLIRSFGESLRGLPGAEAGRKIKLAAAKPVAALAELARNCRRLKG
jgi:hypothetical protein